MKLFEKMRQQKLLSTTLMLFTLSLGIVIGTLLNTGVHAQRGQAAAPDATPLTIPKATAVGNEFTKLAKILEPSVVNITADFTPKAQEGARKGRGPQGDDDGDDDSSDLFRRFFGGPGGGGDQPQQSQRREQSGTGFIVDKNGYIVTNNHVVDGVDHIRVKLHGDETQYRARLIGADRETDVAVIKIDPKRPLAPVTSEIPTGCRLAIGRLPSARLLALKPPSRPASSARWIEAISARSSSRNLSRPTRPSTPATAAVPC